MVRTTKHIQSTTASFYDAIGADYDLMTNLSQRFVKERPFYHMIVRRYNVETALDAGCGTGFHSLLLAQLGVNVTAVDISKHMITALKAHARELSVHVTARRASFEELGDILLHPVDAVFCLGNTLPHLEDATALRRSLESFCSVLRPGGSLFIQLLNYERILRERPKVIGITNHDHKSFIRMYEYTEGRIDFTILSIDHKHMVHTTQTVRLRPWTRDQLLESLHGAGFPDVDTYGNIALNPFSSTESKDLVLHARKPE